jgi:hypothetical protein
MELINATRMTAGYSMGLEASGRELLVVVVKGTFRFPRADEPGTQLALHEEQLPLAMADTFTGEPGLSAPVLEADFAPRKPRCDILLLGSAHAPQGRPATRVEVGLRVGRWSKRFVAIGPRHWDCGLATLRATDPAPFLSQPISYDVAFGGTDLQHEDPAQHAACMANPVGVGFHKHLRPEWVDGKPLPLTEEAERRVTDTTGPYHPMSFGPVGRGWLPRSTWAGTYDAAWVDHHFPFLPPDFDDRYHQSAPPDQQLPLDTFGRAPVEVVLTNLDPGGTRCFTIPPLDASVHVFPKRGACEQLAAALDTVTIEPDAQRFSLTWRVARPLRRNMFEVAQVLVGKQGQDWWERQERFHMMLPEAVEEA